MAATVADDSGILNRELTALDMLAAWLHLDGGKLP
jgi:hypothetical protein